MIRVTLLGWSALRTVADPSIRFHAGKGRSLQNSGACGWRCRQLSGDGECNAPCNTEVCGFDGGDCMATTTDAPVLDSCGCEARWLGNGICELFCNYRDCGFDGGDCSREYPTNPPLISTSSTLPERSTCHCSTAWLGNGICDRDCNTEECSFDKGDCEFPTGTPFAVALSTSAAPTSSLAAPPLPRSSATALPRSPGTAEASAAQAAEGETSTSLGSQELQVSSFHVEETGSGSWKVSVSGARDGGQKYADAGPDPSAKSSPKEDAEASSWTSLLLAMTTVFLAFAAGVLTLLGFFVLLRTGHAEVHPWLEEEYDDFPDWQARKPDPACFHAETRPRPTVASKSSRRPSPQGSAREETHRWNSAWKFVPRWLSSGQRRESTPREQDLEQQTDGMHERSSNPCEFNSHAQAQGKYADAHTLGRSA